MKNALTDLPEPGSIIKRRLQTGDITEPVMRGFFHFGIYIGEREVVDLPGQSATSRGVRIRKVPLEEFLGGEKLVVHRVPKNADHGKAIVEEAIRFVTKNFRNREYHMLFNNCEGFAEYCYKTPSVAGKSPRGWCTQVQKGFVFIGGILVGVGTLVVRRFVKRR